MLKIKSGKLVGNNISFSLPVNFYLEKSSDTQLLLISFDGAITIDIRFEKNELTTEEFFDNFIEETNALQIGNYIKTQRGKGTATAVYCEYFARQTYLERYTFKTNRYGEKAILIVIETLAETIYEVLESPSVKAFIRSIKYSKK